MRLLIHYVGDSHQPLHGSTRIDHEFPESDFGGNTLHLPNHDRSKNLHAVWDHVVYEFPRNPKLPMDSETWADQTDVVERLLKNHPVDTLDDVTDLDPVHWEEETFHIASTFVYIGVEPNKPLSEEYIQKGQQFAEKQLVKAGHRLANLLKSISNNLGPSASIP